MRWFFYLCNSLSTIDTQDAPGIGSDTTDVHRIDWNVMPQQWTSGEIPDVMCLLSTHCVAVNLPVSWKTTVASSDDMAQCKPLLLCMLLHVMPFRNCFFTKMLLSIDRATPRMFTGQYLAHERLAMHASWPAYASSSKIW